MLRLQSFATATLTIVPDEVLFTYHFYCNVVYGSIVESYKPAVGTGFYMNSDCSSVFEVLSAEIVTNRFHLQRKSLCYSLKLITFAIFLYVIFIIKIQVLIYNILFEWQNIFLFLSNINIKKCDAASTETASRSY